MKDYKLGVYNIQGKHKLKYKFKSWWRLAQNIEKLNMNTEEFNNTHVIKYMR